MQQRRLFPWHACAVLWSVGPGALLGACAIGGGGSFPADSAVRPAQELPARFEPVAPITRVAPHGSLR